MSGARISRHDPIPSHFDNVNGCRKINRFYLKLKTHRLICANKSLKVKRNSVKTWDELGAIFFDVPKIWNVFF